jgi:hypothetical protein
MMMLRKHHCLANSIATITASRHHVALTPLSTLNPSTFRFVSPFLFLFLFVGLIIVVVFVLLIIVVVLLIVVVVLIFVVVLGGGGY